MGDGQRAKSFAAQEGEQMDHPTFMRRVAERLHCDLPHAEGVTFAVLHELHGRLPAREADDVAAQLPVGLKRLWEQPEWGRPRREKIHEPEFIRRVRRLARLRDDAEAERATRAVFAVLQRLLGSPTGKEGEAWDVFSVLPKDLKMLWLSAGEHSRG